VLLSRAEVIDVDVIAKWRVFGALTLGRIINATGHATAAARQEKTESEQHDNAGDDDYIDQWSSS
jgi:hypothetical protein